MAERSAVSKLLNGDGPSGAPGGPAPSAAPVGGGSSSGPSGGGVGSGGGGGGGGQATFTASSIRALGGKVAALEPMLETVSRSIDKTDVDSGAWSGAGVILANVYPQVHAFAVNDIKSKSTQLDKIAEKLKSTAMTWERAEQASTVQPQK